MRSSQVFGASDFHCESRNNPGFNPSILRYSRIIQGAASEPLLNKELFKIRKNPPLIFNLLRRNHPPLFIVQPPQNKNKIERTTFEMAPLMYTLLERHLSYISLSISSLCVGHKGLPTLASGKAYNEGAMSTLLIHFHIFI